MPTMTSNDNMGFQVRGGVVNVGHNYMWGKDIQSDTGKKFAELFRVIITDRQTDRPLEE